jgi:hypothetical protein
LGIYDGGELLMTLEEPLVVMVIRVRIDSKAFKPFNIAEHLHYEHRVYAPYPIKIIKMLENVGMILF